MSVPDSLPADFRHRVLDETWGQWWRVHSVGRGAWFFASADDLSREPLSIGRFDLPSPHGTCYLSDNPVPALAEVLRDTGVTHAQSQRATNERQLSQMRLDRWYGQKVADMTSPIKLEPCDPVDVTAISRTDARQWALAAHRGDFCGILYRLHEDPDHRCGLALFDAAGPHEPRDQPWAQPIVVGARSELHDLFRGYRGDPLAA